MEKYVPILKRLIMPEGIVKNFDRILDKNIIINSNYDGVNEKWSFKEFKNINTALFKTLQKEGFVEKDYVKEIRGCFKAHKNRHFKNLSIQRSLKTKGFRLQTQIPGAFKNICLLSKKFLSFELSTYTS